ncbi:hypothetical protein TNCV_4907591 [Trichonephila clavipes]|uniref:Uncharacterized protein n=1 Tax=Trichonephila clavipes TaxID=2585209 RepID=A0A8X6RMC7_TRICX|nr:hypothetical protein TNCV_4907591 [Trichonephila clavipes]
MPPEQRGMSPKKLRRPLEHMKMWSEIVCQLRLFGRDFLFTHTPLFVFALWRVFPLSITYGPTMSWTGYRQPQGYMRMSQQRDLPESMEWRVIGRLESGQTQRSVADAVGVARSVVARNRKC